MLSILIALLFLGKISQAGPDRPYAVEPGTASGGDYRLTSQVWQVSGVASGGGYRLLGPADPSGGNQCCCTYLPCTLRNY
jgi:hypothetical protein